MENVKFKDFEIYLTKKETASNQVRYFPFEKEVMYIDGRRVYSITITNYKHENEPKLLVDYEPNGWCRFSFDHIFTSVIFYAIIR